MTTSADTETEIGTETVKETERETESLSHRIESLCVRDARVGWPSTAESLSLSVSLHGWFRPGNMKVLSLLLRSLLADSVSDSQSHSSLSPSRSHPLCVVELGAWLGRSTTFLCEEAGPEALLFSADLWANEYFDADAHYDKQEPHFAQILKSGRIYEQFLHNLHKYKYKIISAASTAATTTTTEGQQVVGLIPMKMDSVEALHVIHELGVKPDLIYIDASHHYDFVVKDVQTCLELFPGAVLVGDDWDNSDVRRAVIHVAKQNNQSIYVQSNTCWTFSRGKMEELLAEEKKQEENREKLEKERIQMRAKRGFDAQSIRDMLKRKKS